MSGFVRISKFRHVYGKSVKRDLCYDNIRITKSSYDSQYCDVNPKFVAIVFEAAGGGAFLVLPISKVGRVEADAPLVSGHKQPVLDIQFCPHNDNIIASGSEDCTVKIWEIPDEGLKTSLTEPIKDLQGHQKRVTSIKWHPSAQNVLLTAGSDDCIYLWDVANEEIMQNIELDAPVLSLSFNFNGSKFACALKNKKIRVYDPRSGEMLQEGNGHEGSKPMRIVYLKNNKIFTTGFSRMSDRQYGLWDENNLSKAITMENIDQTNGVIFPFYDQDVNMVYLVGRGDSTIRYFEVTDEFPFVHFLSLYQGKDALKGFGAMPKRGLNLNACEIARIYKLTHTGLCEVISFTVPRKSDLFQEDLYPDTASIDPAISAEDWFAGMDADPIMMSLKDEYVSTKKPHASVCRKSNILDQQKVPSTPRKTAEVAAKHASTPAASFTAELPLEPAPAPTPTPAPKKPASTTSEPASAGFDPSGILEDIRKLKLIVKAHERRIKTLEDKVSQYEANTSEEDCNANADAC